MERLTATKVEIIIGKYQLEKVIEVLHQLKAPGYSVMEHVMGMGERGIMRVDEPSGAMENVYVVVVCDDNFAEGLLKEISPVLKRYGGLCVLSQVTLVKP